MVREDPYSIPGSEYFLSDYADEAAYALELALNPEKKAPAEKSKHVSIATPIAELMGARPLDLKHSHLKNLFEEGYFDHDVKLKTAAYLASKGISYRDRVGEIAPAFDYDEFVSYQARAHRIVEDTLPELFEEVRIFEQEHNYSMPLDSLDGQTVITQ